MKYFTWNCFTTFSTVRNDNLLMKFEFGYSWMWEEFSGWISAISAVGYFEAINLTHYLFHQLWFNPQNSMKRKEKRIKPWNENYLLLPCTHLFHSKLIKMWSIFETFHKNRRTLETPNWNRDKPLPKIVQCLKNASISF